MKWLSVIFKHLDGVADIGLAIAMYMSTRDESDFADELTKILLREIEDETGDISKVDEEKIRQGMVQIVDGLEPLFH